MTLQQQMVINEISDTEQLLLCMKKIEEGESIKEGECYPNRCPLNDSVTFFDDDLSGQAISKINPQLVGQGYFFHAAISLKYPLATTITDQI